MKKTIVHGGAAQNGRAGASAGASGGGGGISGLTAGIIPVASSPTTISNSKLSDDGQNLIYSQSAATDTVSQINADNTARKTTFRLSVGTGIPQFFMNLIQYGSTAAGTIYSIALAGLSRLFAVNTRSTGLMIDDNGTNLPIIIAQNGAVKMQFNNGDVRLPSLPSLSTLGTDATGKIIAGSGGGGGFGALTNYTPNFYGGTNLGSEFSYILNDKYMTIFYFLDEVPPGTTIPVSLPSPYISVNRSFPIVNHCAYCEVNPGSGFLFVEAYASSTPNSPDILFGRSDGLNFAIYNRVKITGQITVMVQ